MGCRKLHQPVLLREVLDAMCVKDNGVYVDASFGRGGHSHALLERLSGRGRLLVIDRDPDAVRCATERLGNEPRVVIEYGSFGCLSRYVERNHLHGLVDGILFDLGVSSPQLDEAGRGFSFRKDAHLDMRMDPTSGMSAADWLRTASEAEIADTLWRYGEERYARRIARAIAKARSQANIERTTELQAIVAAAVPFQEQGKDPATRSFQAIRIKVNDELRELQRALPQAVEALASGGRLVVISFHSLEDRIVKRFMREAARGDVFPPDVPVRQHELHPRLRLVGKVIRPCAGELQSNPRARSAVMRVAERI